jgi:hypothetical protein
MRTLAETCKFLHISRSTLRERCRRLKIEPKQSRLDRRFRMLSDEQVIMIRRTLNGTKDTDLGLSSHFYPLPSYDLPPKPREDRRPPVMISIVKLFL